MAATLLVVTLGCSGPAHGAATTPAATATPTNAGSSSPSPSPAASPSPSPADLPLSTVTFNCKLPVVKSLTGGDYASFAGGFVSFPGATFQADPNGAITSEYLAQDFVTIAAPALHGSPQTGPPYYDAARRRWIPAGTGQSSPDGALYAYSLPNSIGSPAPWRIHLVDIARATEKAFTVAVPQAGKPNGIQVAAFDASGVYFVVGQVDDYPAGVWLLDIATGTVRALAQLRGVMLVHGRYAWVGRVDPHDTKPPFATGRRLYDSIVRVDLISGAETRWYYSPSHSVVLRGLDSQDHPVVTVSFEPDYPMDTSEIRLIDTPGTGGESNGEIVYGGGPWLGEPQADRDRLWFGSDRGIYVYTPAGGLQKVFSIAADRNLAEAIFPVGACQ